MLARTDQNYAGHRLVRGGRPQRVQQPGPDRRRARVHRRVVEHDDGDIAVALDTHRSPIAAHDAARCGNRRPKISSAMRFFIISSDPPAIIQPRVRRWQYSTSDSVL